MEWNPGLETYESESDEYLTESDDLAEAAQAKGVIAHMDRESRLRRTKKKVKGSTDHLKEFMEKK